MGKLRHRAVIFPTIRFNKRVAMSEFKPRANCLRRPYCYQEIMQLDHSIPTSHNYKPEKSGEPILCLRKIPAKVGTLSRYQTPVPKTADVQISLARRLLPP